ncbi:MAG TPA: hypothetical protein VF750_01175 [Sphingomicrobium sp.]
MRKPFALVFASAALIGSVPAAAQAAPPDITRDQARARAEQLFAQFDMNHDGIVTRKEANAVGMRLLMQRAATGRDVAPGIGGQTLKYLEHAFTGIQWATEQQFEDAFLAHFDQMDVDHDGVLSASERERGRVHSP